MSTTNQVHKNKLNPPNPTGRGGFKDNPHHQSPGGWKSENTISYQYNRFINMSYAELKAFEKLPDTKKTMAMMIAFRRVAAAGTSKGLPDAKEVADRTEGRAFQQVDVTSDGEKLEGLIIIQDKDE